MELIYKKIKKEDRVLIRNCFKEYKHKSIIISNQIYKDGGFMDKSVLYITDSVRHQKHGLITSDVSDIKGSVVLKLHGFLNAKSTLNEEDYKF